jgi:hypothetical protein
LHRSTGFSALISSSLFKHQPMPLNKPVWPHAPTHCLSQNGIWCSARWFEGIASAAMVKALYRLKTDRISVRDDF